MKLQNNEHWERSIFTANFLLNLGFLLRQDYVHFFSKISIVFFWKFFVVFLIPPKFSKMPSSFSFNLLDSHFPLWASLIAQLVKNLPAVQETQVWSLGWEDPLEKEMATHSSTLAWKITWTEKPGGLQSMGLQRVEHDWVTNTLLTFS